MVGEVKFGIKARNALVQGVNGLVNAVRVTIGLRGRNVALDRSYGVSFITSDGVTIAKEIGLEDVFANMDAQLVREVATEINDAADDSTMTATVLARAMINEGAKNIAAGSNLIVFRKGVKKACDKAVETIREMSQPISGKKQIARVAAISASNNEIGEVAVDAMEKVTDNGVITIEKSKTMKIELDLVEGMQFDRGYVSTYMANDVEKMEATLEDPYILITDKKVSNIQEVLLLLGEVVKSGAKLFTTAEDVEGETLATLIVNKLCGTFSVVTAETSGYGDRRKEALRDIMVLTGGTVTGEQLGLELKDARMTQLGRMKSVKITKESTVIVDGLGKKADISARTVQVKAQFAETSSEFDKERLQECLAKLSSGVAMVRVGAITEAEMGETESCMEDAFNATKAAAEEGIVVGGDMTYVNTSKEVQKLVDSLESDEKTGAGIVMKALKALFFYIAESVGLEGTVIVNQVRESKKGTGFDVYNEVYVDMVKEGILDPTKVTRTAFEDATSVASTLLTAESTVVTIKELQTAPAMPAGDMGDMM